MITEAELLRAIRECEADPVTYGSCEKLANFYIIYDHLFGGQGEQVRKTVTQVIDIDGKSDFLKSVNGKSVEQVMALMDELMEQTLKVINPRLYDAVLSRLNK